MRAQISFEILSITIVIVAALSITTVFVDINAREQKALTEAQALVKTISDAVEIVNLLGEGSYKTVYVYVPSYVNSSRTFANNATLNYGIELTSGTTDIFDYYGECIAGDLPTHPGYYNILVYYESGCTYLDYNLSTDFPTVDCWGIKGECDETCLYSNFGNTSYYNDPGCSSTCLFAGEFYAPTLSCNNNGSGSCYKFSNPNMRYTACTQGSGCAGACSGTPTSCNLLTLGNCTNCGCTLSSGSIGTDVWTESFSTSTDWATFSSQGSGIAYVNDAANCVDDANDDCLNLDGGGTYYLYKQTSEDLSTCELGTAWFYIAHVKEAGSLEGNDCVYVAFSNNGGGSWSSDYTIFCDDDPNLTYNITIPNTYLTNDFRIRIGKQNFQSGGEMAWIDDFTVHCAVPAPSSCGGSPNTCASHVTQESCEACGCNWNITSWDWALSGAVMGYDNYTECEYINRGCWGVGGSCTSSCNYANVNLTNYFDSPGCSGDCPVSGQYYLTSGSCSNNGTGDCYAVYDEIIKGTTCTKSNACAGNCTGSPAACNTLEYGGVCLSCGCSSAGGSFDKWTEDFSTSTDWATFSSQGSGIAYVNDAANCVDDANDDCLNLDGGGTYYLYKQTSEDLSTCELGTAWFYIAHVKEAGSLEGNDCVYVAFSNNGGGSWSSDYMIFCNDNPSSTYNLTIPNTYLTNDFRIRIGKQNFQSGGEMAWLDDIRVHCSSSPSCSGAPYSCSTYASQGTCETCGCDWSSTAWNWNIGGVNAGYQSYEECEWYD